MFAAWYSELGRTLAFCGAQSGLSSLHWTPSLPTTQLTCEDKNGHALKLLTAEQ